MIPFVLAHAGHWLTNLAFFGPVVALPAGLYVVVVLERRRGEETPDDGGTAARSLTPEVCAGESRLAQ